MARPQCTATSKLTGNRCGQVAVEGFTVCKWHGAGGGRKPKHGRQSTVLPKDLAKAIERAQQDPDLLTLRHDVALATGLLDVVLEEYAAWRNDGSEPHWWQAFDQAQRANAQRMEPIDLDTAFQQRIMAAHKQRMDGVKGHHAIEANKHRVYTVREAEAMIAYLVDEVRKVVRDPLDRMALLNAIAGYLKGDIVPPSTRLIKHEDSDDMIEGEFTAEDEQ